MRYFKLTCLLVFIAAYSFAGTNNASFISTESNLPDTVPSIRFFTTNTNIAKIITNKNDPTDVQSKIRISWDCTGCSEVYIKGLDSASHLFSGAFETDDQAFSYTLIGISGNTIFTKEISASLAYKRGTGIDGRIYYLKEDYLNFRKKSFKYSFESKKTFTGMVPDITSVLQDFGYVSESSVQDNKALVLECDPLQPNPKLCADDDCKHKVGDRRIERKLGITVIIEKTGNKTYTLHITPTVMMNYPLQDRSWKVDPDEYITSKDACDEISKKILDKLEK